MAVVTTTKTIQDGKKIAVIQFTGVFTDGTGNETDAVKVDASALVPVASATATLKIMRIWFSCSAVGTYLEFDGATDGFALPLTEGSTTYMDYRPVGGLRDNATTPTGDITLTTVGTVSAGTGYSVIIEVWKS